MLAVLPTPSDHTSFRKDIALCPFFLLNLRLMIRFISWHILPRTQRCKYSSNAWSESAPTLPGEETTSSTTSLCALHKEGTSYFQNIRISEYSRSQEVRKDIKWAIFFYVYVESWNMPFSEKIWAKAKRYNGMRAPSGNEGKWVGTVMLDLWSYERWIENGGILRKVLRIKKCLGPGNTPEWQDNVVISSAVI